MSSKIRSTALPALAFAVSLGLLAGVASAQASTSAPASVPAIAARPATAALAASAPKPRIAPPARVVVHEMERGKVTVSWSRVRGVTRYQVHAYKTDPKSKFVYPFNIVPGSNYVVNTASLAYTFVNNFSPRTDAKRLQALPWVITVSALSPNSSHRQSSPKEPTLLVRDKVIVVNSIVIKRNATAAQTRTYKNVVTDCATKGLAAGVGTAGAGGLVALAAIWIPGVNAATWATVAVASAATAISTTFVCIAVKKINPDGHVVSVSV